jgi:hypothetical protein
MFSILDAIKLPCENRRFYYAEKPTTYVMGLYIEQNEQSSRFQFFMCKEELRITLKFYTSN